MASTSTQVCNLALDKVPASSISSLADGTFSAKICSRQYPQAFEEMLSLTDWGFALTRVALTAVPNDRPEEWAYAYAVPAQHALSVRVVPTQTTSTGSGLLAGQSLSAYGRVPAIPFPFVDAGLVIFTNLQGAVLEFVTEAVISQAPPLFIDALSAKIAAKIVLGITKDERRLNARRAEEEVAVQRAMAWNMNRNQATYGDDFVPADVLSREGL